ncbi:MAG TPA: energy transducer TonB [Thermoanaerobaculia bacterium]|nr:energy transducer TonB [Thermoanaerobaculia bacterium]
MSAAVDHVLERRSRRAGRRPEAISLTAAALLHGVAVGLILLLPRLAPSPPALSFVPVQIIPAQALGVRRPASRPKARKPPEPEPEKAAPQPEPEEPVPEPPRKDVPVLPPEKPEKKPPEPKPRTEAGTGTNPAGTSPQPNPDGEAGRRGGPTGSPLGSSAFGSQIAGLDNPDFKFGYYIDQLLSAIDAKWLRPPLSDEVQAIISFRIERDGSITDLEVAQSSGYNSFDLAALRAVQNASPFPPLPRAYRHDSLGVNLIVR